MKSGRSIVELAQELERQRTSKKDYLIDTRNLRMDVPNGMPKLTLLNDGGLSPALGVNDVAHRQIGAHLGIPAKYYDKMRTENPELLVVNANSWFQKEPATRMIRALDGQARAYLSDSYRRIDNYEIAETVLPIISDIADARIESCEVTDQRMYIKVVNPRLEGEIKTGDVVQSGLMITNSEVGLGSVKVQPLVYRLVCLNGMVVNDAGLRKYHIGRVNEAGENFEMFSTETIKADDAAFMMKVRDIVRAAVDEVQFERVLSRMRDATQAKMTTTDVPKMVELAASDFGMTKGEGKGVLDHLIRDGDFNLFGLANAVTRFSQDVQSYDRATELESIGYNVLTMSRSDWNRLNRDAV